MAKIVYRVQAKPGQTIRLSKAVVYHTSRGVPVKELSDRCRRTLDRVAEEGIDQQFADQRAWMDAYWERCDVEIPGQPEVQQAVRWNLFQLAQAAGRAEGMGIPAKGVSGSGYGGHYFWDTEVYVMPFLTYTSPMLARNALRFRYGMLPAADAAGQGPAAGRSAVPVAHDQRRGGVGLLRRRHRAVPHRRRHLVCAEQVRRRDRRRGVPGARGDRHPGADGSDVGRPRLLEFQRRLRSSTSTVSPAPTSTRPWSTTTCSPT